MNWKNSVFGLLLFSLLTSCGSNTDEKAVEDNFSITGRIDNAGGKSLFLEALTEDGTIDVAQTEIQSDGTFELTGNIPDMGIYQLRMGSDDVNILPIPLSPNEKIQLKTSVEEYSVSPKFSGSKWTSTLNSYMTIFNDFAEKQTAFARENNGKITDEEMLAKYLELRKPVDEFAKKKLLADPSNPVNLVLVSVLSPSMGYEKWDENNLKIYQKLSESFAAKYPASPLTKNIKEQYEQLRLGFEQFLAFKASEKAGVLAPEIALKNPEGKVIKLSDLRGKYVLIDFWASWCGPCRRENPNIVKLYKEYKNKNFTIYSVSLDENADAWKQAILADGLIWPNHVSDLKAWNTPLTQLYGFNGIPFTVLLDKEGKVIAKNLRGESLEQKLKAIL